MKYQAVRGTRDFYPEEMSIRNAIFDAWRRVSVRSGFSEIDGPILEHLELLTAKSGEEIVSQLFSLTDRGGRVLALRPEMTPTLARMIIARARSLPRPIKWFCIPRCFRAERPQRGRLREFFQWNIDVVGEEGSLADAETIFVAVDLLQELGLGPEDVVVKISSRTVVGGLLEHAGIPAELHGEAFVVLDRVTKLSPQAAAEQWEHRFGQWLSYSRMAPWLDCADPQALLNRLSREGELDLSLAAAVERLQSVFHMLHNFNILEFCDFDLHVVRGLDYYTGLVFEILDRKGQMRAVCGGGRYDKLLSALGGPDLPAVGFGMGDVVLANLLEETGQRPRQMETLNALLIDAEPEVFETLLRLAGQLRRRGVSCAFSYRRQGVSKQLREAANRGAASAIILGRETRERGVVSIKNLATGHQAEQSIDELLERGWRTLKTP